MNTSTNLIDQKIWIDGILVSSKSDCKWFLFWLSEMASVGDAFSDKIRTKASGMKPGVIYSANECSDTNCGTLPAFSKHHCFALPLQSILTKNRLDQHDFDLQRGCLKSWELPLAQCCSFFWVHHFWWWTYLERRWDQHGQRHCLELITSSPCKRAIAFFFRMYINTNLHFLNQGLSIFFV